MTKYKFLKIGLLTFFIFIAIFPIYSDYCKAEGREIYVNGDYFGYSDGTAERPYQEIKEALDVAENGDTIYIFGGLYRENLVINKKIELIGGVNEIETEIDCRFDDRYLIEVIADEVTIEDITVSDNDKSMTSPIGALICLKSDNNRIISNIIGDTASYGIYISSQSKDNIISGNIINDTKIGINVYSSSTNDIIDNQISNCSEYGIYQESSKENNRIYGNNINNCTFGICIDRSNNINITNNIINGSEFYSIYLIASNDILIQNNQFFDSVGDGIYLFSSETEVSNNMFKNNRRGIIIAGNDNFIKNNSLYNQTAAGINIEAGYYDNILFLNNFIGNPISARDLGYNKWYYENKGNYWDDYDDSDRNFDGIGDKNYNKNGVLDPFPLGYFLKPPNKPSNPIPEDSETGVGLSITLEVLVTDPDSEVLTVYFYKADDDSLIKSYTQNPVKNVQNNSRVSIKFNLGFDTIYSWYVIADDGLLQNRSSTFVFVTRKTPPDNEPPIADANGPYSAKEGDFVSFDSSKCYDPDGTIEFYRWNFGDGSSEILIENPIHKYEIAGEYQATLTVIDNNGTSDSDVVSVTVGELPSQRPVADIGGPYTDKKTGQLITFDGSGSYDDIGIKSYTWEFHDGEIEYGQVVERSYKASGTYFVKLTVVDTDDLEDSDSITIKINKRSSKNESPGFDIIFIILIAICIIILRKVKLKT
jgi:parallel beta-helix repeat protein